MRRIPEQWLRTVLMAMYKQPTITRSEILKETGLNPASLSHSLRQLIAANIVVRAGELESRSGRPRDLLRLNPDSAYFVAIDLEASPIRFAVTNLLGDVRYRWEEGDASGPIDVSLIGRGVEMVCRPLSGRDRDSLLAIGISRPGIADEEGKVTSVNLGWDRFPLVEKLAGVLSKPVFVESSGRAYVLAERWQGRARASENCVYIEVGKGVGAGIISGGSFFRGPKQAEFGHITIDSGAPDLCKCGKTGCLEAIASSGNIVRQYLERVRTPSQPAASITVSEVIDRARRGDPHALAVIDRAMRAIGLGLSYLVVLFNPELFILGGYVIAAEDFLLPRIRAELKRNVRDWMGQHELAVSNLGVDIGLKGASSHAFHGVLGDENLLRRFCSLDSNSPPRRKRAEGVLS